MTAIAMVVNLDNRLVVDSVATRDLLTAFAKVVEMVAEMAGKSAAKSVVEMVSSLVVLMV